MSYTRMLLEIIYIWEMLVGQHKDESWEEKMRRNYNRENWKNMAISSYPADFEVVGL